MSARRWHNAGGRTSNGWVDTANVASGSSIANVRRLLPECRQDAGRMLMLAGRWQDVGKGLSQVLSAGARCRGPDAQCRCSMQGPRCSVPVLDAGARPPRCGSPTAIAALAHDRAGAGQSRRPARRASTCIVEKGKKKEE
eukprot:gene3286-biopygen12526